MTLRFLPLSRDSDISTFSCGHADLDEFPIEDSMEYQQERLPVTRLAYTNAEIVGCIPDTVAAVNLINRIRTRVLAPAGMEAVRGLP